MNQKKTHLESKKSSNKNSNNKLIFTQNQRDALKSKIIEKFGVSVEESEKILLEIEKKSNNKVSTNTSSNVDLKNNALSKNLNNSKRISKIDENNVRSSNKKRIQKINVNPKINNLDEENIISKSKNNKNNEKVKSSIKKKGIEQNKFTVDKTSSSQNNFPKKHNPKNKNVDSILQNIVPDYNSQISIEVNHVDLTFEVQNEKIDTLKETFVRTLKRNKSKKIKIHALKDVSFQIHKGEKVGVIGYNGAGKSTLLGVITGIYLPDKGTVSTVGKISPLLSLGAGFDQNFSGRRNIMLNGAVLGYDKSFLESKVDEIIEFSELGKFIDIPLKNYSSGMLAKLGFSIATVVEPDILIIDEILGVGDVNFQKKCRDKIMSLMDGGTTVILVSHAIPQIRSLCDKAIWIDNGRLRDMGEVNRVCDEYLKDAEKATKEQLENIQFR